MRHAQHSGQMVIFLVLNEWLGDVTNGTKPPETLNSNHYEQGNKSKNVPIHKGAWSRRYCL